MRKSSNDWNALLPGLELENASPSAPPGGVVNASDMREALAATPFVDAAVRVTAQRRPITLIVNDSHRPTDSAAFLSAVFALLDGAASLNEAKVRLLFASGTHRDDADERALHESVVVGELRERLDEIDWNDADDVAKQARIGKYGFHRWMGEGGLFLACGSTEPHYFAGVTGAHKTLTVGVMSRASIEENHAHAMDEHAAGLKLAGNPVHEGIVDALTTLEGHGCEVLCLNQLVVDGSAAAIWAGHPLETLDTALPTVRRTFGYRLDAPVDLVVATVVAPLDRDLYQADKGIKNTEAALRRGGLLLVDAACPNGVGIAHFLELLKSAATHEEALRHVGDRGYRLGDHKAVRLRALTDRRRVQLGILSDGLGPEMEQLLGARVFDDPRAAAEWVLTSTNTAARGVWARDAGNITLVTG